MNRSNDKEEIYGKYYLCEIRWRAKESSKFDIHLSNACNVYRVACTKYFPLVSVSERSCEAYEIDMHYGFVER